MIAMKKNHAYDTDEWEAYEADLKKARDKKTGTITQKQVRLTDYTTNMLMRENMEGMAKGQTTLDIS